MKKFWTIIVFLAAAGGLFLLLRTRNPAAENPITPRATSSEQGASPRAIQQPQAAASDATSTPGVTASGEIAAHAASPNPGATAGAATNEPLALPPITVLDKARVVIHNYRAALGENPVGTNPEITAALKGKNSRQIDFIADSGLRVNEKGELVDGYGTPFFFHQISGQEMEIRSAGVDRIMWNGDDLVTK
jgi:hypothetical protein